MSTFLLIAEESIFALEQPSGAFDLSFTMLLLVSVAIPESFATVIRYRLDLIDPSYVLVNLYNYSISIVFCLPQWISLLFYVRIQKAKRKKRSDLPVNVCLTAMFPLRDKVLGLLWWTYQHAIVATCEKTFMGFTFKILVINVFKYLLSILEKVYMKIDFFFSNF